MEVASEGKGNCKQLYKTTGDSQVPGHMAYKS